MTRPAQILVDGVLYVPAVDAAVGVRDVVRALAGQYLLDEDLDNDEALSRLRVLVGEDMDEIDGETLGEFAARLVVHLATGAAERADEAAR